MLIFIYVYCGVALLVALRLGWHMIFKLDRFDWQYGGKFEIWLSFAFFAILWPMMVINLRNLINPGKIFERTFGLAARMRERSELWENPPPCGSLIRYRQEYGCYTESYGVLIFNASQVEQVIRQRLAQWPSLINDDEGAILNWLCRRDESLTEPTDVPSAWVRFEFVANDLARAGSANVHCLKCGTEIEKSKIVTNDDDGCPGWNFDRLVCPNGHDLLVVKTMHISV
jgi:hypothetical protein